MATVSHATGESAAPWQTHEVFNQATPLEGIDVFASNQPLVEAGEVTSIQCTDARRHSSQPR